jgi:hypothetical protein
MPIIGSGDPGQSRNMGAGLQQAPEEVPLSIAALVGDASHQKNGKRRRRHGTFMRSMTTFGPRLNRMKGTHPDLPLSTQRPVVYKESQKQVIKAHI